MIGYVKNFDGKKMMLFRVNDKKMLKNCKKTWDTIADLLDVQFNSYTVYAIMKNILRPK